MREVAVESSRPTLLSHITRLRLSYDGASGAPDTLILKTGLPGIAAGLQDAGRREVASYTNVAAQLPTRVVPHYFEAVWQQGTWHLLLEDLTDSHAVPTAWPLPPTME